MCLIVSITPSLIKWKKISFTEKKTINKLNHFTYNRSYKKNNSEIAKFSITKIPNRREVEKIKKRKTSETRRLDSNKRKNKKANKTTRKTNNKHLTEEKSSESYNNTNIKHHSHHHHHHHTVVNITIAGTQFFRIQKLPSSAFIVVRSLFYSLPPFSSPSLSLSLAPYLLFYLLSLSLCVCEWFSEL